MRQRQLGQIPASSSGLAGGGSLGMLSTSLGCSAGRHRAFASSLGKVEGVRLRMHVLLQARAEIFPFLAHPSSQGQPSSCSPSSSSPLCLAAPPCSEPMSQVRGRRRFESPKLLELTPHPSLATPCTKVHLPGKAEIWIRWERDKRQSPPFYFGFKS